jgi:hypothetical protein
MSKEIFGLIVMFTMAFGSLAIAWQVQEFNLLLGYTLGVFGTLLATGVGLNIMTWEKK